MKSKYLQRNNYIVGYTIVFKIMNGHQMNSSSLFPRKTNLHFFQFRGLTEIISKLLTLHHILDARSHIVTLFNLPILNL